MKCIYRGRRRTCRPQRQTRRPSERPAGPAEFSRIPRKPRPATHESASGAFGRLDQRNSPGLSRYQPESVGAAALSGAVKVGTFCYHFYRGLWGCGSLDGLKGLRLSRWAYGAAACRWAYGAAALSTGLRGCGLSTGPVDAFHEHLRGSL